MSTRYPISNATSLTEKAAEPSDIPTSIEGRRVVVVDDKENVRCMLRDVLQAHGIEVQLANDGLSALEIIRQRRPDLILSDINMEGLDGYELLEHVRKDPATTRLPFVLMTGKADLRGMRTGMSRGADDYLPKPFSMAELLEVIRRRFERQEACSLDAENRLSTLRSNLTTMLPHELLTPLNGIIGVATLLDAGDVTADDLASYSAMLHESGDRLHRVVLNFLTLARLEILANDTAQHKRLLLKESCSVEDWVSSLAMGIAKKWKRQSDLSVFLAPLRVGIARQDLTKVLSEILDNAFKFSAPGSRVSLTCAAGGARGSLTVEDAGRGISQQDLENIGAFQQFDRKLHEQQGTGLGIAIAKRFVELHGGAFSIRSTPGVGTVVQILVPLRDD